MQNSHAGVRRNCDSQGRRLSAKPQKGVYIRNGKGGITISGTEKGESIQAYTLDGQRTEEKVVNLCVRYGRSTGQPSDVQLMGRWISTEAPS